MFGKINGPINDLGHRRSDLLGHRQKPRDLGGQCGIGQCRGELQGGQRPERAFAHETDHARAAGLSRKLFHAACGREPEPSGFDAERPRLLSDEQAGIAQRGAAEVDEQRHRTLLLQLSEAGVGNERTGILDHHGAGVRHRAGIIACLVRRVSTVGVDIQANPVPHGRTDLSHAGGVDLEALAAFDLECPKAVTGHHGGRLGGHCVRRLPRERPGELDPARSSPTPPQGLAVAGGMEIPAGIVDQRLRRLVLGNAVEQRAHLDRIIQIHRPQQGQKNLFDRRHQAAGGDAAPGWLDRNLGDARESGVALQAQEHERRRLFDDVAPSHRPLVA